MDTVTYPHPDVRKEMGNWVFGKVDVSKHPEVARAFGVVAVPVAVAVTGEGNIMGKIPDFIEPGPFRDHLARIRNEGK